MPGRLAQSDTRVAFPIVPTCGQVYVPGQMNSAYPLEVGHGCHHFEIHICICLFSLFDPFHGTIFCPVLCSALFYFQSLY